ncbi:preprotein translocase subunit SecD [Streptomyces mesophilus]|uniref:preprotein translocase subunit SecD n=1 Tax=Streptomyces mesophilus TaxID=1775132 RepID=UPI00331F3A84
MNTGMRRTRGAKWGLAMAGAALVLAGCGGSGSDGDWLGERRGAGSGSPSSQAARKAVVTFTTVGGQEAPVSVLEQTAALMRERAGTAKLEGVEIEVRDGRITATGSGADEAALKSLGRTAELGFRPVTSAQPADKGACRVRAGAASEPLTTCGTDSSGAAATTQYVLEPVALPGSEISRAQAALDENVGAWTVNLDFTTQGADHFAEVTGRLSTQTPPQNQFAIVLDGEVLSAPSVSQAITGGQAQISGNFTERTARALAAQLSSGALPLDLEASSVSRVPAG